MLKLDLLSEFFLLWNKVKQTKKIKSWKTRMPCFKWVCQIACHEFILARVVYVPTCQKRANFSFLRANVPTCQRHADFSTQRANVPRCVNFSSWRANMARGVSFCSTSRAKRCANFSTIFQKNYIFYLQNIYVPNIFIYFVHLNYIPSIYILYAYIFLPKFIHRV